MIKSHEARKCFLKRSSAKGKCGRMRSLKIPLNSSNRVAIDIFLCKDFINQSTVKIWRVLGQSPDTVRSMPYAKTRNWAHAESNRASPACQAGVLTVISRFWALFPKNRNRLWAHKPKSIRLLFGMDFMLWHLAQFQKSGTLPATILSVMLVMFSNW